MDLPSLHGIISWVKKTLLRIYHLHIQDIIMATLGLININKRTASTHNSNVAMLTLSSKKTIIRLFITVVMKIAKVEI